jgi:hypothetical protein
MPEDPKNPNAWWAVHLPPILTMFPGNLNRSQKRRLYWIFTIVAFIGSIEIFYLIRLMK